MDLNFNGRYMVRDGSMVVAVHTMLIDNNDTEEFQHNIGGMN